MSITTRAAIARPPHPTAWEITELRLDEPKAHEVRVKVMAAGLCHSTTTSPTAMPPSG